MDSITHALFACLVAMTGCLVYRMMTCDNYQEIVLLEKSIVDLQLRQNQMLDVLEELSKHIEEVMLLKESVDMLNRRVDQKSSVLKFVVNDVNNRLRTVWDKIIKVTEYECYHWTPQDLDSIHLHYSVESEKTQCEYYPDNVFTQGNNNNYPGCEECWCCKKTVDTVSPPKYSETSSKRMRKRNSDLDTGDMQIDLGH